jgi:hypothetical protein
VAPRVLSIAVRKSGTLHVLLLGRPQTHSEEGLRRSAPASSSAEITQLVSRSARQDGVTQPSRAGMGECGPGLWFVSGIAGVEIAGGATCLHSSGPEDVGHGGGKRMEQGEIINQQ